MKRGRNDTNDLSGNDFDLDQRQSYEAPGRGTDVFANQPEPTFEFAASPAISAREMGVQADKMQSRLRKLLKPNPSDASDPQPPSSSAAGHTNVVMSQADSVEPRL